MRNIGYCGMRSINPSIVIIYNSLLGKDKVCRHIKKILKKQRALFKYIYGASLSA